MNFFEQNIYKAEELFYKDLPQGVEADGLEYLDKDETSITFLLVSKEPGANLVYKKSLVDSDWSIKTISDEELEKLREIKRKAIELFRNLED